MITRILTHPLSRTVILLLIYLGYGNFHSYWQERVQAASGATKMTLVAPSASASPAAPDCMSQPQDGVAGEGECVVPKKPVKKRKGHAP